MKDNKQLIAPDIVSFTHYPFGFLKTPENRPHHIIDIRGRITYDGKVNEYRWVVKGDKVAGLPVGSENDLEAFVHIEQARSASTDSFEVSKQHILHQLGYPNNGKYHLIINNAITKFRKLNITAFNCLMDPKRGKFYKALTFPFFDSVGILGRGDAVNEIDMSIDAEQVLEQLSSMRHVAFVFTLSKPLRRLLDSSNAIPLDWDIYVSLPEIKSRMLYRTVNKLSHFNIDYIELREMGKLLSLAFYRNSRIRASLEKPLDVLKQAGVIHDYRFTEDNGIHFKFNPIRTQVKSSDSTRKHPLYEYLVNKTNVNPRSARDCVESLYWREEDKRWVIRFYESHKKQRGWNDGMLVLLLKGDQEKVKDELLEARQWIDQMKAQTKSKESEQEAREYSNKLDEMLVKAVTELTEDELKALYEWSVENLDNFSVEHLRKNMAAVNSVRELLASPICKGYFIKAFQEVYPERFREMQNAARNGKRKGREVVRNAIQRSLFE